MYTHFDLWTIFFGLTLWTAAYILCATCIVLFFAPAFPPFKKHSKWWTVAVVLFAALIGFATVPLYGTWAIWVFLGLGIISLIGLIVRKIANRKRTANP